MEKLKKKYMFLIIIVIIGIITGILFSNILSMEDNRLVTNKITEYFNKRLEHITSGLITLYNSDFSEDIYNYDILCLLSLRCVFFLFLYKMKILFYSLKVLF